MPGSEACHNCRRQRLKCDKALPHCQKCSKRGQECLGYGRLLRWETGIASRGKMAGLTFGEATRDARSDDSDSMRSSSSSGSSPETQVLQTRRWPAPTTILTDPLMQDLASANRKYLAYYASHVCKDLVLYDVPDRNPFRDLISMTHAHPMLLHIIVANAALHMSNAGYRTALEDAPVTFNGFGEDLLRSSQSRWSVIRSPGPYNDALAAKQHALCSLRNALTDTDSMHTDVTLATVLLFTEFELLDSGRDTWKHHISGARKIIASLWKPGLADETSMSSLRSCLISTWLVFDIIGSTLTGSSEPAPGDNLSSARLSLLQDAEGNHCSSFPAVLLNLVYRGAGLLQSDDKSPSNADRALELLRKAQMFDPLAWAEDLRYRSPENDHPHREHIAFAHRAAACIYLSWVLLSIDPTIVLTHDLEALVTEIVHHISFVGPRDALLNASTWPAFIAGAETFNTQRQAYVVLRFQELWEDEPWGLFRGALEVLEGIWKKKDMLDHSTGLQTTPPTPEHIEGNWLTDLRSMGVDWLII